MTHPVSDSSAAPDATRPDLQASRVAKHYGAFRAVDDLSFEVARGSFFSILGPSGCGKTTLLRMIAGFLEADAGQIHIGGKPMNGVPPGPSPGAAAPPSPKGGLKL